MAISHGDLADYFVEYVSAYREEYSRFTTTPPEGGGYPKLETSPYLHSERLQVYVGQDGVAIADLSQQPDYRWDVLGGVTAMIACKPETDRPDVMEEIVKSSDRDVFEVGFTRIERENFPDEIWQGRLTHQTEETKREIEETTIWMRSYDLPLEEIISRLTFGTFCYGLDIALRDFDDTFWVPNITRQMGFMTEDRHRSRFFQYLEIHPHIEQAAWDSRNIKVRVKNDVRRDFGAAFLDVGKNLLISLGGGTDEWIEHHYDRLSALNKAIHEFSTILDENPDADEQIFHDYLNENPILLDVYGNVHYKPTFEFPEGQSSALGKESLEPDFIIEYPGQSYKLVELERPSKRVATKKGKPRSGVTQGSFQIAEWKVFINEYYDQIRQTFPGISTNPSGMLVISRTTERSFGKGRNVEDYKRLLREEYDSEVVTYDDLLARAEHAYVRLSSLAA